jgi:hypothetical protein
MKNIIIIVIVALCFYPITDTVYSQTLGTNTQIPEGTCSTGVSGSDLLCGNSKDHQLATNPNNAGQQNIPRTYYVTTTFTNSGGTPINVTGLAFSVSPNQNYHASCHIYRSLTNGSLGGPIYQWTGPQVNSFTMASSLNGPENITTFLSIQNVFTYNTTMAATTGVSALYPLSDFIDFALLNGNNTGTVQLQAQADSGTITILPGSNCVVQ